MKKILYIGNKLAQKGHNATAIDVLAPQLEAIGFNVVAVSDKKNKILRLLHMLWSILKEGKSAKVVLIDTYSTLNFIYAVWGAKICRWINLPYVPILHGGNLPKRLERSPKMSTKLFSNAIINVAPSHYLIDAFTQKGFTNLMHIPNTIEIDNYPFLLRKNIQAKLLWVRSFSEIYNPSLALDIVKELINKGIAVTLTMVGPPKDESFKKCKQRAAEENLPIEFTGMLDKKAWIELSKNHDIFINTTNFDNTPVSVIEAMALGLPVVSTNVGGLPYLIESGQNGVLVSPNDTLAFVEAIIELLNNPATAQSIAQNARNKVTQFDWNHVKHQWISLLSQ